MLFDTLHGLYRRFYSRNTAKEMRRVWSRVLAGMLLCILLSVPEFLYLGEEYPTSAFRWTQDGPRNFIAYPSAIALLLALFLVMRNKARGWELVGICVLVFTSFVFAFCLWFVTALAVGSLLLTGLETAYLVSSWFISLQGTTAAILLSTGMSLGFMAPHRAPAGNEKKQPPPTETPNAQKETGETHEEQ